MQRVTELCRYFVEKFASYGDSDIKEDSKIAVAFKLSDGKQIQFRFSPTSTIKVVYAKNNICDRICKKGSYTRIYKY